MLCAEFTWCVRLECCFEVVFCVFCVDFVLVDVGNFCEACAGLGCCFEVVTQRFVMRMVIREEMEMTGPTNTKRANLENRSREDETSVAHVATRQQIVVETRSKMTNRRVTKKVDHGDHFIDSLVTMVSHMTTRVSGLVSAKPTHPGSFM